MNGLDFNNGVTQYRSRTCCHIQLLQAASCEILFCALSQKDCLGTLVDTASHDSTANRIANK